MIDTEKLIKELKQKLSEEFPDFIGIHFFGSRAKGSYHKESDLDLVILFDEVNYEKKKEVWKIIGKCEYENNIFIDANMMTRKDFTYNPFFYNEVIKYGTYYGIR